MLFAAEIKKLACQHFIRSLEVSRRRVAFDKHIVATSHHNIYNFPLLLLQQIAQMAAPAALIGQIQPTPVTQGTVPQVAGSPAQMHQMGQSVASAQGVPLPASVPSIKQEGLADMTAADGGLNAAEGGKEHGVDGK